LTSEIVVDAVRDDARAPVRITVAGERPYRLQADGPTGHLTGEGADLFDATVALREQLERDGWLLQVEGAREDVYPSRMSRPSGRAYVLRPGRHSTLDDLVDTLAPLRAGRAVTVAEQRAHFERWSQSDRT
jgi:hypothetical protein